MDIQKYTFEFGSNESVVPKFTPSTDTYEFPKEPVHLNITATSFVVKFMVG
ncbi:hypothetical protein [Clostridium sp. UBA7339]|uniref:hypothetical protein n=1 Tax=Clostridium sp. UBA7339 TaxID=1946376 RepID=UPI003217A27F